MTDEAPKPIKLPDTDEVLETSLRAIQLNRRQTIDILSKKPGRDHLLRFLENMNANFEMIETAVTLCLAANQRRIAMLSAPVQEEEPGMIIKP